MRQNRKFARAHTPDGLPLSEWQRVSLETEFRRQPRPTVADINRAAAIVNAPVDVVTVWYRNRETIPVEPVMVLNKPACFQTMFKDVPTARLLPFPVFGLRKVGVMSPLVFFFFFLPFFSFCVVAGFVQCVALAGLWRLVDAELFGVGHTQQRILDQIGKFLHLLIVEDYDVVDECGAFRVVVAVFQFGLVNFSFRWTQERCEEGLVRRARAAVVHSYPPHPISCDSLRVPSCCVIVSDGGLHRPFVRQPGHH